MVLTSATRMHASLALNFFVDLTFANIRSATMSVGKMMQNVDAPIKEFWLLFSIGMGDSNVVGKASGPDMIVD